MKIHHVGYLVKKIDKAIKAFEGLGYVVTQETMLDEFRQVNICFLEKDGYAIELVSPASKESVVSNLMKKLGNTPYHICYETDDFDGDVARLEEQHYTICSERHEAPAIQGRDVCFMIHPFMGMIELVEAK